MTEQDYLTVRVKSITYQGRYINQYEVVSLDAGELPPFEPGDHIDLYFRDGRIRQYSLCNDPAERHRYLFTVLREEEGRGGSKAIFDLVHVGRVLKISRPRSNFPLASEADRHLLVAGGIGITPIMSMLYSLAHRKADYFLYYCTRSPANTAFREELSNPLFEGRVKVHHDEGVPVRMLEFDRLLAQYSPGTHLYYCGPPGFMAAMAKASSHWPAGAVHYELFSLPSGASSVPDDLMAGESNVIEVGYRIKLARSGVEFVVPPDKSIVNVLRENGIDVPTSCEAGLCQTCKTRYLEGEPEHRDYVLDDEAQKEFILVCCSRSKSPVLVLDL
jgi:tert-butyl alcohol monooxygenase/tert-amyl alcohol desaturase reductase